MKERLLKTKCSGKNTFLETLRQKGVLVYDTVSVNDASCGDEWKRYGTCCNQYSLTRYAKRDTKGIHKSIRQVQAMIENLHSTINSMRNINPSLIESLLSKYPMSILSGEVSYEACWELIAKVRRSSLCNTCSGISEVYFKNNKINLGIDTCSNIIETCKTHFISTLEMLDHSYKIIKEIETALQILPNSVDLALPLDKFLKEAQPVVESIKLHQVVELLDQLNAEEAPGSNPTDERPHLFSVSGIFPASEQPTQASKVNQIQASICNEILTISSAPFISSFKETVGKLHIDSTFEKTFRVIYQLEKKRVKT